MLFFLIPEKQQANENSYWLNELYQSTNSEIKRYVSALLNNDKFTIEDTIQTVYEIALIKANELRNHENIKGWLFKTAHNLCKQRNHTQHISPKDLDLLENDLVYFDTDKQDYDLLLHSIYLSISKEEKMLFDYYYVDQLTIKEISLLLNVDYVNLRKQYSRFRQKLISIISK